MRKLILRFLENIECTSNYRESGCKALMKLRNRIRNFGDDIAAMFEHKHAVLTLEITRQKIQDNCLDKYFVVDMKLYSWITE